MDKCDICVETDGSYIVVLRGQFSCLSAVFCISDFMTHSLHMFIGSASKRQITSIGTNSTHYISIF